MTFALNFNVPFDKSFTFQSLESPECTTVQFPEYVNIGATILGTYYKLQSFVFMPVFGLMQGAMPIMSYNYGYGDKKRYDKTFRLAIIISLVIMTVGLLLFQFLPEPLLKMFSLQDAIMGEGKRALRRISLAFVPAAACIVIITAFQSLTKGTSALLMSIFRQLGFLIPCAILLERYFSKATVWFCYPIAEMAVLILFFPIIVYTIKKAFKKGGSFNLGGNSDNSSE